MRKPAFFFILSAFIQFLIIGSVNGQPTKKELLTRIKYFLNASTTGDRAKYMADGYHSFFAVKKGDGKNKVTALQSFMNWDGPLHTDIRITDYNFDSAALTWHISIMEQNDFTKLIGFAGWKGKEVVTFNKEGLICELIYIPDDDQPDYKAWLKPAMEWLEKNMPDSLHEVYNNHKLVQTTESAKEWVRLLTVWKNETSQH